MSVFDKNIKPLVNELNSLTNSIIDNLSDSNEGLDNLDNLYQQRTSFIKQIDAYVSDEKNKQTIRDHESEWKSMMEPLRVKDENALRLLKSKVNSMEVELKQREKQKNVLLYKESEK
jgi:superoxide dismutase